MFRETITSDENGRPSHENRRRSASRRERSGTPSTRLGGLKGAEVSRSDHVGVRAPGSDGRDDSARAQTSIDFVVGMSVFLLTVAFVVAFVPDVFEPFTASGEGDALAADRTAALLSEHLLVDPATPNALNATCTVVFFDTDATADEVEECRFDANADDLETALGVSATTSVNVTVEEDGAVHELGGEGLELRAGATPPESESATTARRVVLLDGEERDLYVRVW
ncbi:hypothetical protein NGM10_03465 [Halorussus salilacus]|uniref:DUF7287 family protein n=1 Tax=Halorussus salilacus TaxID=2953750 RepID=UPI0020A1BF5E|nr:hypothetical protein [Halorussus salilacus]USZ68800.1 hypothetical protein NGM10_03465 [Halorussus salilacus]